MPTGSRIKNKIQTVEFYCLAVWFGTINNILELLIILEISFRRVKCKVRLLAKKFVG